METDIQRNQDNQESHIENSSTTSSEESDSESSSISDNNSITPDYLASLIEKAKASIRARKGKQLEAPKEQTSHQEDILLLDNEEDDDSVLPMLDPGPSMPKPYFNLGESRTQAGSLVRDVEVERIEKSAPSDPVPPPRPPPPKERLTKKQRKEQRQATAGPSWFDLPAPNPAELPKLYQEIEAIRLRNALDPKRFYRKDEGEGKGIKGLPKYFAMGKILPTTTPFGTTSNDNLPKSHRKRTVVDELVDDAEAKRYAKKKFSELQDVREAAGRNTLRRKKAARKPKW